METLLIGEETKAWRGKVTTQGHTARKWQSPSPLTPVVLSTPHPRLPWAISWDLIPSSGLGWEFHPRAGWT